MKLKLRNYKASLITLAAIGVLAISLTFTVWRLLAVGEDSRAGDSYSNLWEISQTQFEASVVAEALARTATGESFASPEETPGFRLAILIRRLSVLLEGEQKNLIGRVGAFESLQETYRRLTDAEPLLEKAIDAQTATRLRIQVHDLANQLRGIANQAMLLSHEEKAEKRSLYLRYVFESFAFIIGIAISAAFLVIRLLKGMQETTQARQLLKQEQELSDLVINNISDQGIVMFDAELRCLLWNPGMEDLLNIKPDQAVGQHMQDLDPIFAQADAIGSLMRATEGMSSIFENETSSPDGQERCLEINCFPVYMAERRLGIAFMRDVTEQWLARKQAERQNFDLEIKVLQRTAALRQAERRLIAAINSASEGFAAFDWTGKLLFANEQIWAAAPVSLWCQEEMGLSNFLQCFAMCEGADMRLVNAKSPFEEIELDLLVKKDTWARLSLTKADGATIFVRLTDISGYKQVAKVLESALERERETTNAYRNFVSMVSHQFRTPLAILDSSAQRILRRGAELTQDELVTRIQKIRNAGTRLTRLVESVLNAAKLDAGTIEVNPASSNLVDLVMDICERQREVSSQADIRFDVPDVPVRVYCDGMLIEQVVVNLLSNAIKYSGDTPIVEIKIWMDGSRAFCSVRDWGIGIPADEISKIFDRFYRARTATGIAGTGIGLNFAQRIMHLHGGDIQVESYEAAGSLFTFDLPIANADQAQQAA
ncbi:sensor histidine kinase [Microvirga tunisiensis]|uniref:histidine kinase n=1 Tax=Microvirga tunisiensis TaxID=2108360 RepID=A0A5N7MM94_9HYPH|nr:PAS domain-containing sensor histidine kinase [Microvirga tunisiensis]MPR09961.1 PAS domain S-box protein [Microvirga tunisiensis]MPR28171.1 PAS domain S-box protein [Microvirga tunisiensis]